MVDKPTILVFVRYYLPGYKCGPITSIRNLVDALGGEFDFRIVTSDRDIGDANPYPGIATDGTWKSVEKAKVLHLSSAQRSLRDVGRILRETQHEVLYLNSFFDPDFTIKPLLARRFGTAEGSCCVLAPRGEFPPAALRLKAWKKRPFMFAAQTSGLYRDLIWQASSSLETRDIQNAMQIDASAIVVAPDLAATSAFVDAFRPRTVKEPLRICFLSRISPKKNLHIALEILQQVNVPAQFDIYGPVEDERYWAKCKGLMEKLTGAVRTTYRGSVEYERVVTLLSAYDLFFLPTLGENYGHVIYESLSAGTPVLIADTTPWCNLAEAGVGWDLPIDHLDAFRKIIAQMANLSFGEQIEMRRRASCFAEARRTDRKIADATRDMFAGALAQFATWR